MKFVLYGTKGCGACDQAKYTLTTRGLEFEYHLMGYDILREEVVKRSGDEKSLLQVFVVNDGLEEYIGGNVALMNYLFTQEKKQLLEG